MTQVILSPSPSLVPAALYAPAPKAAQRVLEFCTAQINNDHTRKAYLNPTRRFAEWCATHGLQQLAAARPGAGVPCRRLRQGATGAVQPDEARALLDAIDITTLKGLRDRALIGRRFTRSRASTRC
jgi:site-specific recombinase XerD